MSDIVMEKVKGRYRVKIVNSNIDGLEIGYKKGEGPYNLFSVDEELMDLMHSVLDEYKKG